MPIEQIFKIESLDALAEYLQPLPSWQTRQQLVKLFFQNILYRDVTQWNRVVRLCEALTIFGWGDLQPVQAVRTKYYNGFPWTMLVNRYGERRYVDACWCRRGKGHVMDDKSVVFHGSDDLPSRLRNQTFVPSPEPDVGVFHNQRNWIVRSPIWIGQTVTNCYASSKAFVKSVEKLHDRLRHEMRPEIYGPAIDQLCFYYHLSYHAPSCSTNYVITTENKPLDDADKQRRMKQMHSANELDQMRYELVPRYLYGPFRVAQGQMNISIHLTKEFSQQTTQLQKLEFAKLLSTAIDEVITKLRAKRLDYDLDAMQTDAKTIIRKWATPNHETK